MEEISVPQLNSCINISDVLCFFPETHRRNLDIRQHAENTNITTPPSSTDKKQRATPRACGRSTVYCYGLLLYRRLRSVISHHRLCICCAVHVVSCVRCVARLARAVKKKEYGSLVIWSNGHDARFWIFDGVSSSLAESMSIFFSKPRHHRQHRHHTSNAGCVLQPAGYNAIHACRLPAEQEATPHACIGLSALYYCCGFLFNTRSSLLLLLSDPAISGPAGICCCVIHACCYRSYKTDTSIS